MRMVDLIARKRDGGELSSEAIHFFIDGYVNGCIPDYQASALAMAIYFRGMNARETADLTQAMIDSGECADLSAIPGIKVDKHSTGGVGDTTTLVLAPLVAAAGVPVAKMSGRGLGFTGGTLDKLESIPGFSVNISGEQFIQLVRHNGVAVIGQGGGLVPADQKLYALRDVTGSVESIPLIASSIMSKKIAAGADAIVLDVTMGCGAFMKNESDAVRLATAMVHIGRLVGRQTVAVITDMSQPLGCAVGNTLEVKEAIATLHGSGPNDLTELVLTLGSLMLTTAGKSTSTAEGRRLLQKTLASGAAWEKFRTFVAAQGGDTAYVDDPDRLETAAHQEVLPAAESGYVDALAADQIGLAAMLLGAGRATKDEDVDHAAGVVLHKKVGDFVTRGEALMTLHTNRADRLAEARKQLHTAVVIGQSARPHQLIHRLITDENEGA